MVKQHGYLSLGSCDNCYTVGKNFAWHIIVVADWSWNRPVNTIADQYIQKSGHIFYVIWKCFRLYLALGPGRDMSPTLAKRDWVLFALTVVAHLDRNESVKPNILWKGFLQCIGTSSGEVIGYYTSGVFHLWRPLTWPCSFSAIQHQKALRPALYKQM